MQVRLLGPIEVAVAGTVVEVASAKQRALLAALALTPGATVSTDRLLGLLWGDDPPESARTTLRSLVYRLRRLLGGDGDEDAPSPLAARGNGYVLDLDPGAVDACKFERLAGTGALADALALWRGPALGGDAGSPSLHAAARHLEERRLATVEKLAEAELAAGRPADAAARLEAHVAEHPLREAAWGQLMLALYRLGRQKDALTAYQRIRTILDDELGIEPNPALRELETAILQQRPSLAGPPAARTLSETVAFLFTDIQASTRRWEGDTDAMAADLARHDELLTAACAEWSGDAFTHTGDGLCMAFATVADAVGAAVAGQRALLAERGWRTGELRVRMAVHAGAAQTRDGNYFGPTLNRTARLMSTAWGGQVVCSATAAQLAVDQLPDGISLRDLGEHRLADLTREERVFQVLHPELPADFPPLRTSGGARRSLPAQLTSFIGRAGELAELVALLDRTRLVTLAGPGGAGKTRLSLAAAERVADAFPDGAWFVDLAPVRDPAMLPQAVAAGVGLDPAALTGTGRPLVEALCDQLARRHALVVLDNCEQVVEAVADLAHHVLTSCPRVKALATTRERLAIAGEHVMRVGPLGLPPPDATREADADSDAVRLFCDRAAASTGSFALTDGNAAAVVRICHRLDGSPLAIELAASRTRLLSAHQIAERLDDRFALLADGPRSADPRHQTLQAAIDWSHDLLPERERIVLRRLAVFPADFGLEAAEAVAGAGDDLDGPKPLEVLGLIGRLTDKSLVVLVAAADEEPVRYRLLESVRQFAAERLAEAGETETVRLRHRDFFCEPGGWIHDPPHTLWLRRAAVEAENLRAAMEFSHERGDGAGVLALFAQQWVYWWLSGHFEFVEWAERAVAVQPPQDVALLVHARLGLAYSEISSQRWASADRYDSLVQEALEVALAGEDHVMAGWARLVAAQRATASGDYARAEALHAEIEDAPAGVRTFGRYEAAVTAMAQADLDRARIAALGSLEIVDERNTYWRCQTLALLALIESAAGNGAAGLAYAKEGVELARRSPGLRVLVMALIRGAESAVVAGHEDQAYGLLDEVYGTLREIGGPAWAAEALELGAVLVVPERHEAAATLLGAAIALRGVLREEEGVLAVLAQRLHRARELARAALGPERAESCERDGATMHLADVLALARAEIGALALRQAAGP